MPTKRKKSHTNKTRRTAQTVSPADPKTAEDAMRDIMRYTVQCDLESPLTAKFENEGFANVQLSYDLGQHCWEFKAARGTNQGCQTPEQVKAVVGRLVRELRHEVDRGLIVALVLGDLIAARFKLQPSAQPV